MTHLELWLTAKTNSLKSVKLFRTLLIKFNFLKLSFLLKKLEMHYMIIFSYLAVYDTTTSL